MFDVGFSELIVLAIVALLVIGPERLPKVARTLGVILGRMQRYVNDVKADIQREMELDELKKLRASVEDSAREIQSTVMHEVSAVESEVRKAEQGVAGAAGPLPPAAPVSPPSSPGDAGERHA